MVDGDIVKVTIAKDQTATKILHGSPPTVDLIKRLTSIRLTSLCTVEDRCPG